MLEPTAPTFQQEVMILTGISPKPTFHCRLLDPQHGLQPRGQRRDLQVFGFERLDNLQQLNREGSFGFAGDVQSGDRRKLSPLGTEDNRNGVLRAKNADCHLQPANAGRAELHDRGNQDGQGKQGAIKEVRKARRNARLCRGTFPCGLRIFRVFPHEVQ